MGKMPLFKPVQRIIILKDQEEGDREELLIRIREALLQVMRQTYLVGKGFQKICGSEKQMLRFGKWLWTGLIG